MSTARCPACGSEYLATVTTCVDCGVGLVPSDALSAAGGLDEEEAVAYDLDDWAPAQRADLVRALVEEAVPHEWEGSELVVAETHADLVEELIDAIDNPDALAVEDDDGDDDAAEVLSRLYVAADVLAGDPDNAAAVVDLLEAAEQADRCGVPYGLDGASWEEVRSLADDLADLLGTKSEDDDVRASARALRDRTHPLV